MDAIIYDCEIIKAIPPKNGGRKESGIEYCEGWRDFDNMGISVIGVYDWLNDSTHVFLQDNISQFEYLVDAREVIIGFNSISFDNNLCLGAKNIVVPRTRSWDLLAEIWVASGLPRTFQYPDSLGFSLDEVCKKNGLGMKSGNGALAPVLWQKGLYGQVINYCLHDVQLTKLAVELALDGKLKSPKTGEILEIDTKMLQEAMI